MQTLKIKLVGTSPLLMHNERLADPLDAVTKELKRTTSKKKKTDEDHEQVARIEWEGGLYFDDKIGPYLPGWNLVATLKSAGRLSKRGKDIERAVNILEDKVPVQYSGPRKLDAMYKAGMRDRRSVGVMGKRVIRTRPRFEEWAVEFTLLFEEGVFNRDDLVAILADAGTMIGTGDFRPRFGRFSVEVVN